MDVVFPLNNRLLKLVVRVERALVCVEKGRYVGKKREGERRTGREKEQASALKARKE